MQYSDIVESQQYLEKKYTECGPEPNTIKLINYGRENFSAERPVWYFKKSTERQFSIKFWAKLQNAKVLCLESLILLIIQDQIAAV